jgi:hypothetical protein
MLLLIVLDLLAIDNNNMLLLLSLIYNTKTKQTNKTTKTSAESSASTAISYDGAHVCCNHATQGVWNPIQLPLAVVLLITNTLPHPTPLLC